MVQRAAGVGVHAFHTALLWVSRFVAMASRSFSRIYSQCYDALALLSHRRDLDAQTMVW